MNENELNGQQNLHAEVIKNHKRITVLRWPTDWLLIVFDEKKLKAIRQMPKDLNIISKEKKNYRPDKQIITQKRK